MKKFLRLLLATMMIATTGSAWAVTDYQITFTTAIESGKMSIDQEFGDSKFLLNLSDDLYKTASVDESTARFGMADQYDTYTMRFKPGVSSSTPVYRYMYVYIDSDYWAGILRIAARSADASDTQRTLGVDDNYGNNLYYGEVYDSQAVQVTEGGVSVPVYPYIDIPVGTGWYKIYCLNGELDFYSLSFMPYRTCLEANEEAKEAGHIFPMDEFHVVYSNEGYTYIYDWKSRGFTLLYGNVDGLEVGKSVRAGMMVRTTPYYGLPELRQITPGRDLYTYDSSPWDWAAETAVPSESNPNQYTVYHGVTFSGDASFSSGSKTTVVGTWRGQQINFYNALRLNATLEAGKSYDILAFPAIYKTTYQAYPAEVTEHINYDPTNLRVFPASDGNVTFTWEAEILAPQYKVVVNYEKGDIRSIRNFYVYGNNSVTVYDANISECQCTWSVVALSDQDYRLTDPVQAEESFVWPKNIHYIRNMQTSVDADGVCTFTWEGSTSQYYFSLYNENWSMIESSTVNGGSSYSVQLPVSGTYQWDIIAMDNFGKEVYKSGTQLFSATVPSLGTVTVTVENESSMVVEDEGYLFLWWWVTGLGGHLTLLHPTEDGKYTATIDIPSSYYNVLVVNRDVTGAEGWTGSQQTRDLTRQNGNVELAIIDGNSSRYNLYNKACYPTNLTAVSNPAGYVDLSWDARQLSANYEVLLYNLETGYNISYSSHTNSLRIYNDQYDAQTYSYAVRALGKSWNALSPVIYADETFTIPAPTYRVWNVRTQLSSGECTITWESELDNHLVEIYDYFGSVIYSATVSGKNSCTYTFTESGMYICKVSGLDLSGDCLCVAFSDWITVNFATGGPNYTPTDLKVEIDDSGEATFSWNAEIRAYTYQVNIYTIDGYLYDSRNVDNATTLTLSFLFSESTEVYWTVSALSAYGEYLCEPVTGANFVWAYNPPLEWVYITIYNRSDMPVEENNLYVCLDSGSDVGASISMTYDADADRYNAVVRCYESTMDFHIVNKNVILDGTNDSQRSITYHMENDNVVLVLANPTTESGEQYLLREPDYTPRNLVVTSEDGHAHYSWDAEVSATMYRLYNFNLDGSIDFTMPTSYQYMDITTNNHEDRELIWGVEAYVNGEPVSELVYGEQYTFRGNPHYIKNEAATQVSDSVYQFSWEGDAAYYHLAIFWGSSQSVFDVVNCSDTTYTYTFRQSGNYSWRVEGFDESDAFICYSQTQPLTVYIPTEGEDYSPRNLQVSSNEDGRVTFRWEADPQAPMYIITLYDGHNTKVLYSDSLSLSYYSASEEDLACQWSVRAADYYERPISGEVFGDSFTLPARRHYITNAVATPGKNGEVTFSWESSLSNFIMYIYDYQSFYEVVPDIEGHSCVYTLPKEGTYYWGLEGYDADGVLVMESNEYRLSYVEPEPEPDPENMVMLKVVSVGEGTTSITEGKYAMGTNVTITATPKSGNEFLSWSSKSAVGKENYEEQKITLELTKDLVLAAIFADADESNRATVRATIAEDQDEWGSVKAALVVEIDEKKTYIALENKTILPKTEDGIKVRMSASANDGYEFRYWNEDKDETDEVRTVTVKQSTTWTAYFKKAAENVENVDDNDNHNGNVRKCLVNGQLVIIRGGQEYTIIGQRM